MVASRAVASKGVDISAVGGKVRVRISVSNAVRAYPSFVREISNGQPGRLCDQVAVYVSGPDSSM